jgi:hypothetical protein
MKGVLKTPAQSTLTTPLLEVGLHGFLWRPP